MSISKSISIFIDRRYYYTNFFNFFWFLWILVTVSVELVININYELFSHLLYQCWPPLCCPEDKKGLDKSWSSPKQTKNILSSFKSFHLLLRSNLCLLLDVIKYLKVYKNSNLFLCLERWETFAFQVGWFSV